MQIEPDQLFESVITWLRERYRGYRFFAERDLVWTIQVRLVEVIEERELPYWVFNDYPMGLGARTDIAIVDDRGDVGVAIEVKYEPDHARRDIPVNKFPVGF